MPGKLLARNSVPLSSSEVYFAILTMVSIALIGQSCLAAHAESPSQLRCCDYNPSPSCSSPAPRAVIVQTDEVTASLIFCAMLDLLFIFLFHRSKC
jgi:hypothetical protein